MLGSNSEWVEEVDGIDRSVSLSLVNVVCSRHACRYRDVVASVTSILKGCLVMRVSSCLPQECCAMIAMLQK